MTRRAALTTAPRLATAVGALALFLLAGPLTARAQVPAQRGPAAADSAPCSILEIEASNGKESVDPELKPLGRKLKKPPFSSWKTFKLLKKHQVSLQRGKQLSQALVTGARMGLLYRDKSDTEGKKVRLRLAFTLDDRNGKRKLDGTIKLDAGDYYLIGGDELKGGGTYIVAVSCKAP